MLVLSLVPFKYIVFVDKCIESSDSDDIEIMKVSRLSTDKRQGSSKGKTNVEVAKAVRAVKAMRTALLIICPKCFLVPTILLASLAHPKTCSEFREYGYPHAQGGVGRVQLDT